MKLTYRGHAYEVPAPTQPSLTTSSTDLKLLYRGHTYGYMPQTTLRSGIGSEVSTAYRTTLTLLYRGHTYKHQLQTAVRLSNQFPMMYWRNQRLEEV